MDNTLDNSTINKMQLFTMKTNLNSSFVKPGTDMAKSRSYTAKQALK